VLVGLSADYLENDRQSYRQAVGPGGRVTGYRSAGEVIDERALHHATLYRMLSWLGAQSVPLQLVRQMIQQRNPSSTCHRFLGDVAPQKFRSLERQRQLRQARQLLHLIGEWEGLSGRRFFPRFATRAGFG